MPSPVGAAEPGLRGPADHDPSPRGSPATAGSSNAVFGPPGSRWCRRLAPAVSTDTGRRRRGRRSPRPPRDGRRSASSRARTRCSARCSAGDAAGHAPRPMRRGRRRDRGRRSSDARRDAAARRVVGHGRERVGLRPGGDGPRFVHDAGRSDRAARHASVATSAARSRSTPAPGVERRRRRVPRRRSGPTTRTSPDRTRRPRRPIHRDVAAPEGGRAGQLPRRAQPAPDRRTPSRPPRASGSTRSTAINTDVARRAASSPIREREAAAAIAPSLERLALEADAARIKAETAEAACVAAREAVADCDEAQVAGQAASQPQPSPARPARRAGPRPSGRNRRSEGEPLAAALRAGQTPRHLPAPARRRDAMSRTVGQRSSATIPPSSAAGRPPDRTRRCDRGRSPSASRRSTSRSSTRSGARSRRAGPRHRGRPVVARVSASTASEAGSTSACPSSATCRWRSATPGWTRCGSATGPPRPRCATCSPTSRSPPTSTWPGPPAT